MILSTGARVRRYGFYEELLIEPAAVDLSRVAAGVVKVLNSHNAWDVGAIFGTVLSARIEGGALIGTMKFAETPTAAEAEGMVARGELTSVSIGYDVQVWRAAEILVDPTTSVETTVWRADEWTLMEVSFVSIPADPSAGVRSAARMNSPDHPPANTGDANEEPDMTHSASGAAAPVTPTTPAARRMTTEEAITFMDSAKCYGVEAQGRALLAQNVHGEIGPETCSEALLRSAAERQRANTAIAPFGAAAHVVRDGHETLSRGIEDALVSRISGAAPSEIGRQYRSMSMIDMIRYDMRQRGERNVDFWAPSDVVKRMHTTSDFPILLTSAGNRVLEAAFAAAPSAIKSVARRSTVDDFRTKYSIKLGSVPALPLTLEGGEVQHLTTSESYQNYKLGTYGGMFTLSRQAIINDDLNAFGDFTRQMSQAAAETEAAQLVALLIANNGAGPKLVDGNYLFAAANGNVAAAGAAVSVDSLSAARLAMRTQKAIGGKTLAPAVPTTLLVGAARETESEKVLAALTATKVSDTNPFSGKLSLAVEPRLTGSDWYVFADPALSPVLEYAYLTGHEGPQLDSREGWDTLGVEFRVVLDFGCGVIDHRGAYRNPGN